MVDLLPELFDSVLAPPAVAREFGPMPAGIAVTPLESSTLALALDLAVGPGEAEAIALAAERGCRIILDDRRARFAAARLGLGMIGTVGILLRSKSNGLITEIEPSLDALAAVGFRVDAGLRRRALELAGEIP